ncbi:MAG TPA: hypothetical protein EYN66_03790 [Myxococcales bacterium]|nr:hypothetical protein [Myxococcales bacterium]
MMSHTVEPHAVAIPFAVAGQGVGNPRMAGMGSHLQRYFADQAPAGRVAPYSYAINLSSFNLSNAGTAATSIGLHPASAQPIPIQLGENSRLPYLLPRPTTAGFREHLDALVSHYTKRYRARLQSGGDGVLRAPGFKDFSVARDAMSNHELLSQLLPAELFDSKHVDLCVENPMNPGDNTALDETTTAIQMARHLLTAGHRSCRPGLR